jgi:hypothetical protein
LGFPVLQPLQVRLYEDQIIGEIVKFYREATVRIPPCFAVIMSHCPRPVGKLPVWGVIAENLFRRETLMISVSRHQEVEFSLRRSGVSIF